MSTFRNFHITIRHEFDNIHLYLNVHDQPTCPEHDLIIAYQYRQLLYKTQIYLLGKLSKPIPFSKVIYYVPFHFSSSNFRLITSIYSVQGF